MSNTMHPASQTITATHKVTGEVRTFKSQHQCAKALQVAQSNISAAVDLPNRAVRGYRLTK